MTITKNMKYADLLAMLKGETPAFNCSTETLIEFVEHEMALNAKKNAAPKKPSKAQVAKAEDNKALAQVLYNALFLAGKPMTVAEIKTLDGMNDYSSPKLTALLKILILEDKVSKDDSGRVAKYQAKA
jgi:hypothetical protein